MLKINYSKVLCALSVCGLALGILSGCQKSKEEDKDYLTVNPAALNFKAEGDRSSVSVKSSTDWTFQSDAQWITVQKSASGRTLSVEVAPNPLEEVRTGTVTLTGLTGITASVTVRQTGINPALEVDRKSVALSAEAGSETVVVTSNIEWKAEKQSDWLTVDVDQDNLILTAKANPLFESRSDVVKLVPVMEQYAALAVEISVEQAASEYSLTVASENMGEDNTVVADAPESVVIFSVVANSDWSVTCDAPWVKCKPSEGGKTDEAGVSVAVEIAENTEPAQREASLTFVCGKAERKVTVAQRNAGVYLEMDNEPLSFADESASVTIPVSTNGKVSFSSTGDWVKATYADGQITVEIDANTGARRTATLTVTAGAGEDIHTDNIEITQLGYAVNLSENGTANCYVVNRAGTYKIKADVKGNGASTVGLERVEKSISPNGAMIVWATDTTGCVGNLNLFNGYLYFETNGADGNAVIAATNDEYSQNPNEPPYRTILWSWHIWMTGFDIDNADNQYEVSGDALGQHSTFMGRNLGALSSGESGTEEDILNSFGLQYQWGRKDPFPGPGDIPFDPKNEDMASNGSANPSNNATIYCYRTEDGKIFSTKDSRWTFNMQVEDVSVAKNVQRTVENPEYFMKSASTAYLWCTSEAPVTGQNLNPLDDSNPWGYLWGNPNVTAAAIGEKSIYDPCPVGWQVPNAGAWYFITAHGSDMIYTYGYNGRWKYNHVEGRTATIRDISAQAREKNNDWNFLWNNSYIRMKDMKGGFNIFYTDHNKGEQPEGGDRFDIMVTTYEAGGPTMFLPAAGVKNYYGEHRRAGFGCHYWSSGIRSTDLKKNERLQANACNIDYQGNLIASFASDFNQLVCSRSVRCVKTEM